ncbi:SCP2 sterol-binding domain-containing protein [Paracoccus sp. p4-l81]|uniref:SCP2 sterol-binding domain-containing protein n=1 Tax=unclassified Paracoccus (in: a-proteobacteria) TaxID=2688777 RepID=UPI0035B8F045
MSDVIDQAVTALNAKLGTSFSDRAKFVIPGEGAIMADSTGVRAGDEEADVTMTADADTFKGILDGDINPTMAFMTGRLKIDGSMGLAMKLGAALS